MLNSAKIKPIVLAVVKLHSSEGISQSVSQSAIQSVSQSISQSASQPASQSVENSTKFLKLHQLFGIDLKTSLGSAIPKQC